MGKLLVEQFITMDGVVQAPGGPDEDREGGFKYGGWQAPFVDDEALARVVEEFTSSDAVLLGRRTYDIFAGYWPFQDQQDPIAKHINTVPKYVASNTLTGSDWAGTTVLSGDIVEQVRAVKDKHELIGVSGSGNLVRTLLASDLVDELSLWTHPITLGTGKKLWGEGVPAAAFTVVDVWSSKTGVVLLKYERAGEVRTGDLT